MQEFNAPEVIYGVDYSASKRDAGRNTWIAKCDPIDDDKLVVDCLADAAAFLNCMPKRNATNKALVECIVDGTEKVRALGIDFPFGLPSDLLETEDDWHAFVADVPDRWGALGEVSDPATLYEAAREYVDGDARRLRRVTDDEHGGQAPTGFRIKTQTYYGISCVLAPVADDVSVLPMDAMVSNTLVLETYPAGTFRKLEERSANGSVFPTGYKRDTHESIRRRRANVDALADAGVVFGRHRQFAVATDDALDAVAAAYATWRATEDGDPSETASREGHIFA